MKTKTTLMITMLFLSITLFAQEYTQTVKGKITDTDTKIPLPGASVTLAGSDPLVGTISDMDGNFRLENVPIGRQSFEVSYMGYQKIKLSEVLVSAGREVLLNVEMQESVTTLDECTIVAKADPGRTAQSFVGVSSADDENNKLVGVEIRT